MFEKKSDSHEEKIFQNTHFYGFFQKNKTTPEIKTTSKHELYMIKMKTRIFSEQYHLLTSRVLFQNDPLLRLVPPKKKTTQIEKPRPNHELERITTKTNQEPIKKKKTLSKERAILTSTSCSRTVTNRLL